MNYTQIKLLSFAVIVFMATSCTSEDISPKREIITGDPSSVDHVKDYSDWNIYGYSETVNSEFNEKRHGRYIDIDGDGENDLYFSHVDFKRIDGYQLRTSDIYSYNLSFRIMIAPGEEPQPNLNAPIRWKSEGELIELSSGEWQQNSTHYRFFKRELFPGGAQTTETSFPIGEQAYLIFTLLDANNRQMMGWMHIEMGGNNIIPNVLDIGYKYLN